MQHIVAEEKLNAAIFAITMIISIKVLSEVKKYWNLSLIFSTESTACWSWMICSKTKLLIGLLLFMKAALALNMCLLINEFQALGYTFGSKDSLITLQTEHGVKTIHI